LILVLVLWSVAPEALTSDRSSPSAAGEATEQWLRQNDIKTNPEALVLLVREHPESPFAESAILLLTLRKDPEARGLLHEIVNDPRFEESRIIIAWGLARLGEQVGVAVLGELLETTRDPEKRLRIASHLAEAGSALGFAAAVELAGAPEPAIRARSLEVLVDHLSLAEADPELQIDDLFVEIFRLSDDPDRDVRAAFVRLSSTAIHEGLPKERTLERLREMCRGDADEEIRSSLQGALAHWAFSEGREVEEGQQCP
jgi:hypothetical protein